VFSPAVGRTPVAWMSLGVRGSIELSFGAARAMAANPTSGPA
jgi:hypothetical protein